MKIFICASKHNYKHIPKIKNELEAMGHSITLPNSFNDPFIELRIKKESKEKHIEIKQKLLKEQVIKIRDNDAIVVVNFDKKGIKNYIGGATFLEMYKAFELGKKIYLINPIPEGILEDEIIGFNPIILENDLKRIIND
jgi:hypothetical protein